MKEIKLTKHENKTFENQMIHMSGQAFVNCVFKGCTLILTNVAVILNSCKFDQCNWCLNYQILWGDPSTTANLRKLVDLIEGKLNHIESSHIH